MIIHFDEGYQVEIIQSVVLGWHLRPKIIKITQLCVRYANQSNRCQLHFDEVVTGKFDLPMVLGFIIELFNDRTKNDAVVILLIPFSIINLRSNIKNNALETYGLYAGKQQYKNR